MYVNSELVLATSPLVYGPVWFGTILTTILSYQWFWKITQGIVKRVSKNKTK